jgi:type IV secretory pathway VirD2 relaxase
VVQDYYQNFKELKRSLEREEHLKEAQTSFLQQCENNNLIPVPYGLVQYKGKEDEINIKNYMVNDDVANAYGRSL